MEIELLINHLLEKRNFNITISLSHIIKTFEDYYPERTQARTALEAKLILLGQKAES